MRKSFAAVCFSVLLTLCFPVAVAAQSASAGKVVGRVADRTGGSVPGAQVVLLNTQTGAASVRTTDASGSYVFPLVAPGDYTITVSAKGFQTSKITALTVRVAKSNLVNVTLAVGAQTQSVEVTAGGAAQLQTVNSEVGNEVGSNEMIRLPTLQHSAVELLNYQPSVAPGASSTGDGIAGGSRTAGAMDDQNTVTLDGIDITNNLMGSGTSVPIPVDSVQEFRVGVSNAGAAFGRSSGANINLTSRRGTNSFHGALYDYLQNSALNANEWDNNRLGIPRPELHDDRFGGSIGGPIQHDKTFFFFDYEGRRFPGNAGATRAVPSANLRNGILTFPDASGNKVSYNLATSTLCGPAGNQPCDPRGLGISPTIQKMWDLEPTGNDASVGDGSNTIGFTGVASTPLTTNYSTLRLDRKLSTNWSFDANYAWANQHAQRAGQVSMLNGALTALADNPTDSNFLTASLNGILTPNLVNTFHFGWLRARQYNNVVTPTSSATQLALPGTNTADGYITLNAAVQEPAYVNSPIDNDSSSARFQEYLQGTFEYADTLNWTDGNHDFEFGGNFRNLHLIHARADKVTSSITSLISLEDADVTAYLSIPSADRPPLCTSSLTTNCLLPNDVTNWDRLYAASLGMVDSISVLGARDGQLQPLPFGTPIENNARQYAYYFYGQDSWKMTPTLTLTYGLNYGWQTPPTDSLGRQTLLYDLNTNQEISGEQYLDAKQQAALSGQNYSPRMGFIPVDLAKKPIVNTDYSDLAPKVALAWNPSVTGGFFGSLFGGSKTVLRGGYSMIYDRDNTIESVVIPMLSVGFAQTETVPLPPCDATGAGGAGCNGAALNPALSSFRVGQDGTMPLPTFGAATSPIVPSISNPEILAFQDDPNMKAGRSQELDFTVQRELPSHMLLEVGYIGRLSSRLPMAVNLNASPYFFKDTASGQTFAQAYDAVANQLRNGVAPANVTSQPWFENQLPGLGATAGCGTPTATTCLAENSTSAFTQGLVSTLFLGLDGDRQALGLTPYNNDQVIEQFMRSSIGHANYQAMFVDLRKQVANGMTFDLNYTLSKDLDEQLADQDTSGYFFNSYDIDSEYGPALTDRRNVLNFTYNYALPGPANGLRGLLGGWYLAGIFSAYSGVPLVAIESTEAWGGGLGLATDVPGVPEIPTASDYGLGVHANSGSSGVGVNGAPANDGPGLNIFANPAQAFSDFRPVELSKDGRDGYANPLRGLPFWNLDFSVGKATHVTEGMQATFAADFFNLFNNVNFATPQLNMQDPADFGVITGTVTPANRASSARAVELSLRLSF